MVPRHAPLILSLLLAGSLCLPAAASSAASQPTPVPKKGSVTHRPAGTTHPAHRAITLQVWDPFSKGSRERAALQAVARAWERRTGNRVVLGGYAASNNLKMCTLAPMGHGPDLVAVPHDVLSQLSACRAIQPVPAALWPVSAQRGYVPAALQAPLLDGREWGMPWAIATPGIFYNTKLIPPGFFAHQPLQWSTIISRARALTSPTKGRYGLVWAITNFYLDSGIISASGGYVFKRTRSGFDPRSLGIDAPGTVAGLRFIRDLGPEGRYHLIPTRLIGGTPKYLFGHGKVAMFLTDPADQPTFRAWHLPYGFTPMPALGSHPAHPFATVQLLAVSRFSHHPREAFSLLQYLTTHLGLPEYTASKQVWLPVRTQDLASRTIQGSLVGRGMALAAGEAQAVPNIPQMLQVWAPMDRALGNVVAGVQSPEDAAHAAAAEIRRSLASSP